MSLPQIIISFIVCSVALLLPYRARIIYFRIVSELVHLPFKIFGFISKWMLKQLDIENPYEK